MNREIYRPVCRACLCDAPGSCSPSCSCHTRLNAPVAACEVCGHRFAYTEPVPERRGTWRDWLAVCSLDCLNEGKRLRTALPPPPRPCDWCGLPFRPTRRSDARLCSPRCRQAARRAKVNQVVDTPESVQAFLDEIGYSPGDLLGPRFAEAVADALDRMCEQETPC